jgi:DHA1 family inner membrane transport protein
VRFVPPAARPIALLAVANGAAEAAFLPLVPAIRDDLGLSGAEVGALFAATTLAVLVTAVPAGQLAARLGGRPVLLASAVLTPVGLATMAVAPSLGLLLAGRLLYGVGFAVFWSVGPAIASARIPGARGTGIVVAASGVGWLAGPAVSGVLAEQHGWRVPLAVVAVAVAPTALPFLRRSARETVARPVPLRATIGLLSTSRRAGWAAVISGLLGVVTGGIGVLVPTVLAANGVSAAGIGAAIAASSGVWVLAASWSGRIGRGRIDLRLAGAAVAALALCWALPLASLSSAAVVAFLLLAAACRALLGTILYPLAVGATDGEPGVAALAGLVNVAWAVPALVVPVLVGVALEQGATRAVFAAVCALAALVAGGMLSSGYRRPAPA